MLVGIVLGAGSGALLAYALGYRIVPHVRTFHWWQKLYAAPAVTSFPPLPIAEVGCLPGDEPPPLPRENWMNGPARGWSDFSGHVVVIDAWTRYCPVCEEVARDLVSTCREYEDRGVVVVGVTGDTWTEAEAYCERHGISFPVACEAQVYLEAWMADHYPALFVIGRDGRVVWNDGAARLAHHPEGLPMRLAQAIESAL